VVQGRQLGGVNWDELDPEFAATWKVVWDTLGKDIVFRKGEAELLVVEDPEGRPVEDMFAIARTYIDENGHLQRRIFVANFSGSKVSGFMRFPKELRVNQYDEYGLRNLATGELLSRHYPGEYSGRKLSDEGLFVELEPFSKDDVPALDLPFMQVLNLFPEDRTLEPLFEELAGLKTLEEVDVFETAHPALISRLEKAIFERRQDILLKGLNELTTVEAVDEFADLHPYVSASIKDAIAGRREDILSNELKLLTGTRKAIREFIEKRVPGRRAMEESILLAQKYFVEEVNQDFQNTLFIATESGQRFKPTDAFFRRLFDKEQLELFARYLDDEDENIQHIAKVILADYIHSLPPRSLADFIQMVRAMDSPDTAMHRHPELFLGEIKNNPGHVKAMRFIENPSMSRVVFLTSEAAPWTRIGGMGQVMSSLSGSLADLSLTEEDVDATVIMPLYHGAERTMDPQEFADRLSTPLQQLQVPMPGAKMAAVSWLLEGNVTYFFIDNREFFSGNVYSNENQENGRRFAFFTIAALEALNAMNMGVHTLVANDYHSALAPVLLKYGAQRKYEVFKHTKTIQIVHVFEENMGRFEQSLMGEFGIPWEAFNSDCLEDYGKVNVIKGGLHSADHCLTVSKSEARRLLATFGYLFGTLKHWIGILNRISVIFWSPDSEKLLEGCRYNKFDDIATIKSHKAKNKANLQKRFNNLHEGPKVFGHLDENPNAFLIGMIGSRGVKQKGVDIAVGAIRMLLKDPSRAKYEVERILRESGSELDDSTRRVLNKFLEIDNLEDFFKNVQFVWYANADSEYGKMLIQLAKDCPGKVVVNIDYNDDSAMEYYAASDINLMPSRFEPGGYPQQICQRFATIPIVYRTGGLEDAVPTYNIDTRQGVGLAYPGFGYGNSEDLLVALTWALELYRASEGSDFSGHWDQMLRNAIDEDVSWARSIKEYLEIFHEDRNNILSELKEGEYFYGVAKPSPESAMRLDGGKELEERFMAHNEVRSNL
jgi:starch synthase